VVAAICAVVAYQRAVAEQQQVRVRVEQGAAGVAAEAVDVPSVPSWSVLVWHTAMAAQARQERGIPSSKAFPSSRIWAAVSNGGQSCWAVAYLPAPLARIDDIVLVGGRLWVRSWRVHGAGGHGGGVGVAADAATGPRGGRRRVRGRNSGTADGGQPAVSAVVNGPACEK
jgi:hypothetical protein